MRVLFGDARLEGLLDFDQAGEAGFRYVLFFVIFLRFFVFCCVLGVKVFFGYFER